MRGGGEQGIATDFRHLDAVQHRAQGWLRFVTQIGMPILSRVGPALGDAVLDHVGQAVDFRMSLQQGLLQHMHHQLAETGGEFDLLFRAHFLAPEQQHGMLIEGVADSAKEVVAQIGGQIDTADFRAQSWSYGGNFEHVFRLFC